MLAFTAWRPPPTQGPFGRDFEAYYAAGAVWDAGGDPWSRAIWSVERTIPGVAAARDELLPYVGPAAALPLFGALARLPFALAVRLWTGLLAAALGALVVIALVLSGTPGVRVRLGAVALALFAGPTTSDLGLGQAALLSAGGIAVALFAYERRALVPAALATLVAAMQPNLARPEFSQQRRSTVQRLQIPRRRRQFHRIRRRIQQHPVRRHQPHRQQPRTIPNLSHSASLLSTDLLLY